MKNLKNKSGYSQLINVYLARLAMIFIIIIGLMLSTGCCIKDEVGSNSSGSNSSGSNSSGSTTVKSPESKPVNIEPINQSVKKSKSGSQDTDIKVLKTENLEGNVTIDVDDTGQANIEFVDDKLLVTMNPCYPVSSNATNLTVRPEKDCYFEQHSGLTYVVWEETDSIPKKFNAGKFTTISTTEKDPVMSIEVIPDKEVRVTVYSGSIYIRVTDNESIINVNAFEELLFSEIGKGWGKKQVTITESQYKIFSEMIKKMGLSLRLQPPPGEPHPRTILTSIGNPLTQYDPTTTPLTQVGHLPLTSNELLQGDWTKGPQGSGETDWEWGFLGDISLETGEIAESWEFPDDQTIIFNLRKGVKFQNKPPVNGRELTADDVAWSINTQFNEAKTWWYALYPPGSEGRPTSIRALDRYTVEVKVPSGYQALMFMEIGDRLYISPPECWEAGGGWNRWSDVVASGPFILDEYIEESSIKYVKNSEYFEFDPFLPGNRLPYIDELRFLIIPDRSTKIAAFRTGNIDMLWGDNYLLPHEKKSLIDILPAIQYKTRLTSPSLVVGRQDKDWPFSDIRVRQAMNMAVNQEEILHEYLQNEGVLLAYPYHPTSGFKPPYTPLEKQPRGIQELFSYNPDKARELLTEAGFPNGFKASITCMSSQADEVSIIANYLTQVGINLVIQKVDTNIYYNQWNTGSFEAMIFGPPATVWNATNQLIPKRWFAHLTQADDPVFDKYTSVLPNTMITNPSEYFNALRERGIYELGTAWSIWLPGKYVYNMWWPWVKNYSGESLSGFENGLDMYKYFRINPDIKESMDY